MLLRSGSFIKRKYQPLLLSSFFAYLFCLISEFIDTAIGSNMLLDGKKITDAIEVVSPIYQIIVFVGGLISIGCATLFAHYLGKYEEQKAYKLFGQSIFLSLGIGTVMALILFFIKRPFLLFFGCEGVVYDLACDYYNFYIFIAFLYPQYWLLYYMVHNDADEKVCFLSDGLQLGVHIVAAILFVKFTDYGIAGLSLGTLLGLIASYLSLFIHFFKKKNSIHVKIGFNISDAIQSVKLGASTAFTYLFVAIVDIVMNKFIVKQFGDDYLASYSVANLLLNLATVYLNLGESATPFNSVYYGEDNNHGIKKTMKMAHIYCLIEGSFFTIAFIAFASFFPLLFGINASDGAIYTVSKLTCYIIAITMIPTSFLFLYISYYPSIKKEKYSFILTTCYMLVFPLLLTIPICLLSKNYLGIPVGLMLTPIFTFLVLFIILIITKNFKKFPLLLNKDKYVIDAYDIKINNDNIKLIANKCCKFLKANTIDKNNIEYIDNFINAIYEVINKNNENNKHLYSELDVMIGKNEIIISIRDNGKIFDITKYKSEEYISTDKYNSYLSRIKEKSYLTTTSFNRSSFTFCRN